VSAKETGREEESSEERQSSDHTKVRTQNSGPESGTEREAEYGTVGISVPIAVNGTSLSRFWRAV
jgi:hypothetical protein